MNNGCGDAGVRSGIKGEETTLCPRRPLGLFQTGVPDGHLSPSQMSAPLSTRCSKHPMLSRELNVPRRQDDKRAVFRGELRALGGTPAMRLGSGEDSPEGRGHQQMPDREKGLAASPRSLQPRSQPWAPFQGREPAERGARKTGGSAGPSLHCSILDSGVHSEQQKSLPA